MLRVAVVIPTACRLAKAKNIISRRPFQEHPTTKPLERVHYDLIQLDQAQNGDLWVSHFICVYTKFNWLWTHRKKSQATLFVERIINLTIYYYGQRIRFLHSDGKRALGDIFNKLIKDNSIVWESTAPYIPNQNGLIERSGGVIITKARTIALAAHILINLWPETVSTAAYLINRIPIKSLNRRTPFEMLYKHKPSLAHLYIFGYKAYLFNPTIPRTQKLLPRAHIGYLMGYDSTNIYRIWIPSKRQIVRTRNVTFDESKYYDPTETDLGQLLNESELNKAISVLNEDTIRLLADNQAIDEINQLETDLTE